MNDGMLAPNDAEFILASQTYVFSFRPAPTREHAYVAASYSGIDSLYQQGYFVDQLTPNNLTAEEFKPYLQRAEARYFDSAVSLIVEFAQSSLSMPTPTTPTGNPVYELAETILPETFGSLIWYTIRRVQKVGADAIVEDNLDRLINGLSLAERVNSEFYTPKLKARLYSQLLPALEQMMKKGR